MVFYYLELLGIFYNAMTKLWIKIWPLVEMIYFKQHAVKTGCEGYLYFLGGLCFLTQWSPLINAFQKHRYSESSWASSSSSLSLYFHKQCTKETVWNSSHLGISDWQQSKIMPPGKKSVIWKHAFKWFGYMKWFEMMHRRKKSFCSIKNDLWYHISYERQQKRYQQTRPEPQGWKMKQEAAIYALYGSFMKSVNSVVILVVQLS